ncbi:MAG: DUF4416 family protein [Rhodopirellula sp. JB044]|uniref:DUF4416 family protein n=1 Tax=Rhodopirellula sp. JB044 TaxID=3342844 RepID=UPI00370CB26A
MAAPRLVEPVVRFCAVISRYEEARAWAIERLIQRWGEAAEVWPAAEFTAGGFYDKEMGTGLTKVLVAIEQFADPAGLAQWKTTTNQWEHEYAEAAGHDEPRPLNLDPGYVTQAKLVLATVKDRDHRIYLQEGIFAEVTLNYMRGGWVHHRWTYPDYRTEAVAKFAMKCRDRLRTHLVQTDGFRRG